jgi:hypothetical protein
MKKKIEKKNFWFFYHLGLIVFSAMVAILMKHTQTGDAFHSTVIPAFISLVLMCSGIGYLAIFMVNKAKTINQDSLTKRIVPALIVFYIGSYVIVSLSIGISTFIWFLYLGKDFSDFFPHLFKYELSFASGRLFIWLLFFTVAFFYVLWNKSVKKEQKLKEENLKFKYQNLKNQINPHFLFNTLNTLSELVYIDPKISDLFIQDLSSIYRYVIENEETDLIELEKEITFVKQYFNLQEARDRNKIKLELELSSTDKIKVVPVSLQILVENALKHNVKSNEKPLIVRITMEDGEIIVSNPIHRKSILEKTTKTGLSNLKSRTKIITGKELIISEVNDIFTVKLPTCR